MIKYTVLRTDRANASCIVGDTVYKAIKYDFGLARDDSAYSGIEYVSVTHDPNGDYPLFTIPLEDLAQQ